MRVKKPTEPMLAYEDGEQDAEIDHAGRAEQALQAGRRANALNDVREDAHRLIVRALVASGRKAEALKHYQDFAALLKRELNAEPDAATRSLVAELRRARPPDRSPSVREAARPAASSVRDDGPSSAATVGGVIPEILDFLLPGLRPDSSSSRESFRRFLNAL